MHFYRLQQRVKRLIKRLPNEQVGRLPTEYETDTIASILLLASAEIEGYIEKRIENLLTDLFDLYKQEGTVHLPLLLVMHLEHPAKSCAKIDSVTECFSYKTENILHMSHNRALQSISNNHGINTKNLTKMLSYIFPTPETFEYSLMDLSSLAVDRGNVAHNGYNIRNVESPLIVENKISKALIALNDIDENITNLRKEYKLSKPQTR